VIFQQNRHFWVALVVSVSGRATFSDLAKSSIYWKKRQQYAHLESTFLCDFLSAVEATKVAQILQSKR